MRLLCCFPPAGGAAGLYRSWADQLPADVAVRVIRYGADHGAGAPGGGSVPDLAAACAESLSGQRPTAFFGHSLGALVAFECVRIRQRHGEPPPQVLYVAGHVAPHLPSPGPDLHALDPEEFWHEIELLGGTPPELLADPRLRAAVEPRVRSEFRAAETYRFTRGWPLDCDLVALAGAADARAPVPDVAAWRMHTTGSFELAALPGGHFFLATDPDATLRMVRSRLPALTSAG